MPSSIQVSLYLVIFFGGIGLLSLVLTRCMIHLAPRLGLIDEPDHRRIHTRPIPRAGGIAVFGALVTGLFLARWAAVGAGDSVLKQWPVGFVAAAGLILLIGVIDDRFGMSAWLKLGGQVLAATIYFFMSTANPGSVFGFEIPWWCDLGIHIVWTVVLINGFNLIDGMDGLCAGLGLIASTLLGILAAIYGSYGEAIICGVMSFSLLGFLFFNFHPARIFLGDAGSMLIGFFIATVGASAAGRHSVTAAILLPLLIGGVPLLDVTLAIWRRAARRFAVSKPGVAATRIFGPDRDHLHHRLLDWGFTQRRAAFIIYTLAVVLAGLAMLPIIGGVNWLAMSLVGLVVAASVGVRYLAPVEFITSGDTLRAMVRRPWPSRRFALMYYLYDLVALVVGFAFAAWMVAKTRANPIDLQVLAGGCAIFAACGIAGLRGTRAQMRRWSRACVYEFAEMALWLGCGVAASFFIQSFSSADFSFAEAMRHLVGGGVALGLLLLPRSLGFVCLDGVVDTMHRKRRMRTKRAERTTVLYGAGDLGELFLCQLRLSKPDEWKSDHFIGFLDDNPALTGRWIRGFQIIGTTSELAELAKTYRFDSVIITQTALGEEKTARLEAECRKLGISLRKWIPSLKAVQVFSDEKPTSPGADNTGGPALPGDEAGHPETIPLAAGTQR